MAVVIASAVRTAITSFQGGFTSLSAAAAGRRGRAGRARARRRRGRRGRPGHAWARSSPAGAGQAPARQAARGAGLCPTGCRPSRVNKMCGSGLEAVDPGRARHRRRRRRAWWSPAAWSRMTNAPYLLMTAARRLARWATARSSTASCATAWWTPTTGRHMGTCAEGCATQSTVCRAPRRTPTRAPLVPPRPGTRPPTAIAGREIVPVEVAGRKGAVTTVDTDEGPAKVDFDKLPTLRPAFEQDGHRHAPATPPRSTTAPRRWC